MAAQLVVLAAFGGAGIAGQAAALFVPTRATARLATSLRRLVLVVPRAREGSPFAASAERGAGKVDR